MGHMQGGCSSRELDCVASIIRALLLGGPELPWWPYLLIWLVRIITLGLLLRTYIVPTVIRLCSKRVSVESTSLRSIRGIYVNAGDKKLYIERIRWSYHWASSDTAGRIAIRLEGVKVDVERPEPAAADIRRPHMALRFSDFAPFTMARRIWSIISQCIGYLEPSVRPIARAGFVMALRLVIRIVPPLTHVVEFELDSAIVSFAALSGVSVVLKGATVRTTITFTQLEQVIWTEGRQSSPRKRRHSRLMTVIDWKDKLTSSLERTWDRAWGKTQGNAAVSLKITRVACFSRPWPKGMLQNLVNMEGLPKGCFLNLPETMELRGSVHFNPRKGIIEPHGIGLWLSLRSLFIGINDLQVLTEKMNEINNIGEDASKVPQPDSFFLMPQSPAASSPTVPSPLSPSPLSPSSRNPWRSSLLSPTLLRRGLKPSTAQRVKRSRQLTWLSTLEYVTVRVSTVSLQYSTAEKSGIKAHAYRGIISDLSMSLRLSDPDENLLHRKWLGRHTGSNSPLDAPVYALKIFTTTVRLERLTEKTFLDILCLVSLESFDLEVLTSRWPGLLIGDATHSTKDPNEALLALYLRFGDVEVQDQLDALRDLVSNGGTSKDRPKPPCGWPSELTPVPKFLLDIETGSLCARLICAEPSEHRAPSVVQAQSDGLVVSIHSHFMSWHDPSGPTTAILDLVGRIPIRMDLTCSAVLKSTFVRLLTTSSFLDAQSSSESHMQTLSPIPMVSLETLEMRGNISSLGYVSGDAASTVTLHTYSTVMELQSSTDALSIELWQPDVISTLKTIASSIVNHPAVQPSKKAQISSSGPRFGIVFDFAVERAVILSASLDINPSEELDISRGVVLRTGYAVQCCALQPQHLWRFRQLQNYTHSRQELGLAETEVPNAVAATKVSHATHGSYTFIKADCWDTAVRNAVATHFEFDDDPFSTKPDDPLADPREFFHVPQLRAEVIIYASDLAEPLSDAEERSTEITIVAPEIRCRFHLAHSYCLLLGIRTVSDLLKALSSKRISQQNAVLSTVKASVRIDTMQALCDMPVKERLCTRIDGLQFHSSSTGTSAKLQTWLLWVLNIDGSRWKHAGDQWEELGRLRQLRVGIDAPELKKTGISVEAEAARLRVPYGYVLADLVQDINISVKAIRHLYQITSEGEYRPIPSPVTEQAKSVPNLRFHVSSFNFDAMDDPFESRLGLVTRVGFISAKVRDHREEAFALKTTTIQAAESTNASAISDIDSGLRFTAKHSVSIEEAYSRLLEVHSVDYIQRFRHFKEMQSERESQAAEKLENDLSDDQFLTIPNLVQVVAHEYAPRLFDVAFSDLSLQLSRPSFSAEELPDFLYCHGSGLPKDTEFTLLVPLHLDLSLTSLRISLRDYPLPLLNIPKSESTNAVIFAFQTDLVIAEEIGTSLSVDWFKCSVLGAHYGTFGASPFSLFVPKTIMPVKTYANPVVRVTTDGVTDFAWGVSYQPATQDVMRVIDSLTSTPRDSSPAVGFWDKMRLSFHWQVRVLFDGEVHLHMKGSRDPYEVSDHGAGFALCWQGNPRLYIGLKNNDKELIQVTSDTMLVVIPNLQVEQDSDSADLSGSRQDAPFGLSSVCCSDSRKFRKVCAKFSSGIRFGVGFVLERSCGPECTHCCGAPSKRKCRLFAFKRHYEVHLQRKHEIPRLKSSDDSYNGFRSDFIHLSISLTSSLNDVVPRHRSLYSSLHLSPKTFSHFWSWWGLFDSSLSLPIRQGRLYNHSRPQSPKFGRHLATIKYRISVERVFISHVYMDESNESWADGITSFVGMKALIRHFHADMHQREQEMILPGISPGTPKVIRRKPFYAAEVVMTDLDLRAMLATFKEPLKQSVPMEKSQDSSKFRVHEERMPDTPSVWIDTNDYIETDWISSGTPTVHLLPTASCPRFTYFKSANKTSHPSHASKSKFGYEESHTCFLSKEASVSRIQVELARERIRELQEQNGVTMHKAQRFRPGKAINLDPENDANTTNNWERTQKMIGLLEAYIDQLQLIDSQTRRPSVEREQSYYMPLDTVSSTEWAEFDNVYQVHCPKLYMSNSTRDILLQYYYCSRSRRGFEYHMATRAVKFMRDQARAGFHVSREEASETKPKGPGATAQAAAQAFLRRLAGDDEDRTSIQVSRHPLPLPGVVDPLGGCSDGVSLRKSHFCLLLKPQIVLRSEANSNAVCVLAAVQAKLQSFAIMDDANAEDPVSGKILSRIYTSLTGLQAFSPTKAALVQNGCVPLEVFIDLRCESSDFDRLVPQTDATLHYDKFNRLRLHSQVSSHMMTTEDTGSHLNHQTDLVQVHVPQFTVSADDQHFQALSTVITDLILFSDATHKTRLDKLETLLFRYDFTDLEQAADVVSNLQSRLRHVMETERSVELRLRQLGTEGKIEMLKIKAHLLLLTEELNLIFDAIKLAQDKSEGHSDQKSALLLQALSSEISWRMLDEQRELLAKLSLRQIDYTWLSRQDGSTENNLSVGDLQAFDGSSTAVWAEIITKLHEPGNHPLVKHGRFVLAHWVVLAPVGGITVFQDFELKFHPMRLQIDTRVGRRIMEYLWPGRKNRNKELDKGAVDEPESMTAAEAAAAPTTQLSKPGRTSLDSARLVQTAHSSLDINRLGPPTSRRLGASRSFTDLRSAASASAQVLTIQRSNSHVPFGEVSTPTHALSRRTSARSHTAVQRNISEDGDAAVMKTRSSQKMFIRVKVDSLHLLLSVMKQDSFLCREAHIKTRELVYRNQTWSFEELVDQFIPSDPSWRGWVKMALQQPLVPVLPVARELFSKTQWIASKGKSYLDAQLEGSNSPKKLIKSKPIGSGHPQKQRSRTSSPGTRKRRESNGTVERPVLDSPSGEAATASIVNTSSSTSAADSETRPYTRARMISLFKRGSSRHRASADSSSSDPSLPRGRRRQSLDYV